jgi:excisionase family DNA binding protein
MSEYLRSAALAEKLGITRRTLIDWRNAGLIPFIKINNTILFDAAEVDAALKRFERKPQEAA